jgi:hypothetical protein
MDTRILIPIIIVVAAIVVIAALLYARRRKSEQLKQKFGSEYDRVVQQHKDPARAETILADREKRVSHFQIRSLPPADRDRYAQDWAVVQKQFVDDPQGAVTEADVLVTRVMNSRGYPMGDFDQRAADLSVNYPSVVQNYRAAHDIALSHGKGEASTEGMRIAMVHYRSLFDELLESPRPVQAIRREVA